MKDKNAKLLVAKTSLKEKIMHMVVLELELKLMWDDMSAIQ